MEFGTVSLREQLGMSTLRGQTVFANAISELEAGSDLTNLQTIAEQDGFTYVLNGTKRYVTNAPFAHYAVVFCCTDPQAGFLGVSALVVDLNSPGVVIAEPYRMIGVAHAQVASITFNDCRIPQDNLLGQEGSGTKIFAHSMLWERTVMFSGLMGVLQQNLDAAVRFATSRIQRGVPVAKFQAVSHRLVDCAIDIEACRSLIASAVSEKNSQRAALLAMQTKVACSEAFIRVGRKVALTFGGAGMQESCPASRLMADSLATGSFSGSNDALRSAIASKMGL
jgi:clorobiocin biosynthesis protein CloN3